ncbi:prephenate dehydratase [Labilibaculum sp. DW002]|uniref:prephenate dehydratase n=1 Tax=Paralabilibaculum antarcticum TaxID=2912572 RepID=A0ABT5VNZ6_9BACT|nr:MULTISPECIES: prephenate dehydratase [unclassified Labilibaculum]MBI9057436.1 prephenate dehydratase [Labilibaculum sp.]MDE5417161.1 prephenate dehydratase [Labilibaculum sp. DW002]
MDKRKIVIQGVEGCFHHVAANAYYGEDVEIIPSGNFATLIELIQDDTVCDGGIMAIENSIAGSILQNYGLLQDSGLVIEGEIFLRIKQNLMALPGQKIEDLKEVHSHPMAISQCRAFFRDYPHIKLVEMEDTALSAKNIRDNELLGIGAIAGDLPAELYELDILAEQIESIKNNQTRFFILKRKKEVGPNGGFTKASLYFSTSHNPGSLSYILDCFAQANINLSKIQSLPIPGINWEYFFHVDLEFELPSQFKNVMNKISESAKEMTILGTYNKGIVIT